MNKKHLVTIIIGTRPEAIKLAPLILEFRKYEHIKKRIILTGQHKEMVSQVMNIFGIKEDLNLDLMKSNQSLTYITNSAMEGLNLEFTKNKPSLVIVQGDTNTAFAGALSAFYQKIPVGHVEAGLRSDSIYDPFPEESNRRLISQISSLHFAPTLKAEHNLINSNVMGEIYMTGNSVVDALEFVQKKDFKTPGVIAALLFYLIEYKYLKIRKI